MSNARDYLFQIPFKQYSISNWSEHKKKIVEALPLDQYTDFYDNLYKMPSYLPVVSDAISESMQDFADTYPCPVMITSMWYANSMKGDGHKPHNHGSTGYSAILYVDFDMAEHESTIFYSPFQEPATGDSMKFKPNIHEGDLIIFPSMILHEAPANLSSTKSRLIVSFNIMGDDCAKAYTSGLNASPLTRKDFDK